MEACVGLMELLVQAGMVAELPVLRILYRG